MKIAYFSYFWGRKKPPETETYLLGCSTCNNCRASWNRSKIDENQSKIDQNATKIDQNRLKTGYFSCFWVEKNPPEMETYLFGCSTCNNCRASWLTTATLEALAFISRSNPSNRCFIISQSSISLPERVVWNIRHFYIYHSSKVCSGDSWIFTVSHNN